MINDTQKRYDVYSPAVLIQRGKEFLNLYIADYENNHQIPTNAGLFNYFHALELYLKAYLCILNIEYCKEKYLKKLGHNFIKLKTKILKQTPDKNILSEIEKTYEKCNITEKISKKIAEYFRYPALGTLTSFFGFEIYPLTIFETIEKYVSKWMNNKENVNRIKMLKYQNN